MQRILVLGLSGRPVEFASEQHIGQELIPGQTLSVIIPRTAAESLRLYTRIATVDTFERKPGDFASAGLLHAEGPSARGDFVEEVVKALRQGPDREKWQWLALHKDKLPPCWMSGKIF